MLLEGLHLPLTTPFHPDGRLNATKLAANVIRYSKTPASALIAMAPWSGEPTLLDDAETRDVLATVAQAASPEKVLLAHIDRDGVSATLALAKQAASLGYDAILVAPPRILAPMHGAELLLFYQAIADRSELPVVIASLDRNSRTVVWPSVVQLAAHPNILGLFSHEGEYHDESLASASPEYGWLLERTRAVHRDLTVTSVFAAVTARMQKSAQPSAQAALIPATALAHNPAAAATAVAERPRPAALTTRTRTVGFQIVAANPKHMLEALDAGATAIAPSFAACAPQACYEVYAAWKDGDHALAAEKQHRILDAARLAERLGPGGLKAGCDFNGYFGGVPRLPGLPASAVHRAELQRLMQSIRT